MDSKIEVFVFAFAETLFILLMGLVGSAISIDMIKHLMPFLRYSDSIPVPIPFVNFASDFNDKEETQSSNENETTIHISSFPDENPLLSTITQDYSSS